MEIPNQIAAIARIIRKDWKNIYFGAVPYLDAMDQIDTIDQIYYDDHAEDIVRRFLLNAKNWRGEVAKSVKAKLRALLKE